MTESALCSRLEMCGEPMCEKCTQLDEKIAQYRRFTTYAFDPLTTERIRTCLDDLQQKRDSMHPADEEPAR